MRKLNPCKCGGTAKLKQTGTVMWNENIVVCCTVCGAQSSEYDRFTKSIKEWNMKMAKEKESKTMYAQIRFPQRDGLSKTYDYEISAELASEVVPGNYVVIQSARSDYSVGILDNLTEKVADPDIVTKSVVQKVDVPKNKEYVKE